MTYVARNTGIVTDWQQYTPTTVGLGTIGNVTMFWRRLGDSVQIAGSLDTGTTTAVTAFLSLPSGLATDPSKHGNTTSVRGAWWNNRPNASVVKRGVILAQSTSSNNIAFGMDDNSTALAPVTFLLGTQLVTTVTLYIDMIVPIVNWTTNVLTADRALEEYVSNFDASNAASNTTSFAYGPAGSQMPIGAIGTTFNRTAQFLTPILPTDRLVLEFSLDQNSTWVTPESRGLGYMQQGSVGYGVSMIATGASTVLVSFQGGGYTPNNGVYGTNGSAPWSAAGWKWRVRKVSGGASVGFPLSGKNIIPEETIQPPLVSSTTLAFGVGVRLVNSGSPTTQTLPTITAADDGKRIVVKNIGAGTVTVATSGGAQIDGQSTQALNQYECANLMAYNSNWFIV